MYYFNPSIFFYDNQYYLLVRCETNNLEWHESYFSYKMTKLKNINDITKLKTINKKNVYFVTNNKTFDVLKRSQITDEYVICEDIKVFPFLIKNKVYAFTNVLIKIDGHSTFRVGLVKINVNKNKIKLVKTYENIHQKNEKNWVLFLYKNKYYILYSICPLIIYQFNPENYEITHLFTKEIFAQYLQNINLNNIHTTYKNIYLSMCSNILNTSIDKYYLYVKKRDVHSNYEYYIVEMIFKYDDKLNQIIDIELIFNYDIQVKGYLLYLNDVKLIENNILYCFGLRDKYCQILKSSSIMKKNQFKLIK